MKIVFFGTPEFSVPSLKALLNVGFDIVCVVTQPDKPFGRDRIISPTPTKKAAQELNLNVISPESLRDNPEIENELKNLNADIGVVVAYGKIIPTNIINIFPKGILNLHPSLLPKYRGPSPIQTSILNGDTKTGISIMLLDKGMDSGPILYQEEYSIDNNKYAPEVFQEIFNTGANILAKTAKNYLNNKITPIPQNDSLATITKKLNHEDGKIDWSDTAENIYNKIRALTPEPGAWTEFNNKKVIISKAFVHNSNIESGTIVYRDKKLLVGTNTKAIEIASLKPEGKTEMTGSQYVNGNKI